MAPRTRYARAADGVSLAYQVVGDGPIDLLYVPTWINQIEQLWEEPRIARFFHRLTSFARVILFDRRGCGLSDPVAVAPTLEDQVHDVCTVLDAAGSERAAVFAQLEGGPMAMLYAATHPHRTRALMLYATFARATWAPDYDWADTAEQRAERNGRTLEAWGEGTLLDALAPTLAGDERLRAWFGRLQRLAASPGTMMALQHAASQTDVRSILPTIRVPTLVLHRRRDTLMDPRHAEYLAGHIPDAKLVYLPGTDTLMMGDQADALLDEVEEFLTGARLARAPDRVLATVLFTDLVGSTQRATELGDRRWRELLSDHNDAVRRCLSDYDGREVKNVGDGFLATFDGPARAIRGAAAIERSVRALGLQLRAGLHTGEVERFGDDLTGVGVSIAARVASLASPTEVLVSSTVKDLVTGSGIEFVPRGTHALRGVPGEWALWAVRPG